MFRDLIIFELPKNPTENPTCIKILQYISVVALPVKEGCEMIV